MRPMPVSNRTTARFYAALIAANPYPLQRIERILSRGVLLALRLYQLLLSPLFAGSCRFLPSCSDYGIEAVKKHGSLKGIILTTKRMFRCQPLAKGGHDPVPARRRSEPDSADRLNGDMGFLAPRGE